jgi:hypothetical protein
VSASTEIDPKPVGRPIDWAQEWLERYVRQNGPTPRKTLVELAKKAGHSEMTLNRARQRLEVKILRKANTAVWIHPNDDTIDMKGAPKPLRGGRKPYVRAVQLPPGLDHRYRLEHGWHRQRLIHELARQERSHTALAKDYGVTQSAVSQFAQRHADEIQAIRTDIEAEFSHLWVADKRRIAEYQAASRTSSTPSPNRRVRTCRRCYVSSTAAPQRGRGTRATPGPCERQVANTQINYSVHGVDIEKLR